MCDQEGSRTSDDNRLTNLYKTTQTSRKAFRLGKSASYYKKLLALADNKSLSPWQRYLQLIQNSGMVRRTRVGGFATNHTATDALSLSLSWTYHPLQFGFFIYDNMAFAGKAKIVSFDAEEAAKRGGVLWFCANIAGFALAISNLQADIEKEKCVRDVLASEDDAARVQALQEQLDALEQSRFKKFLAVLKVTCDLIVSSNTSGIRLAERLTGTKLHDGIIGSVGCVSALTVLYNAWPNAPVKAKPVAIEAAAAPKTADA